jgi:hypothetical protein
MRLYSIIGDRKDRRVKMRNGSIYIALHILDGLAVTLISFDCLVT